MRKLKKFAALLAALTLSISSMPVLNASAEYVYVDENGYRFTEYDHSDYLYYYASEDYIIFKSTTVAKSGRYMYRHAMKNYMNFFAELHIEWLNYELTEAELETMTEYLDENFPDLKYETSINENENIECLVDSENTLTEDEKLQVAIKIQKDLGYYFIVHWLETGSSMNLCGDVDGSGKLDALDASEILTYYAAVQTGKSASYTEEEADNMTLVGDYDGDGAVNAMDASNVLTRYAEEQTQ